MLPGAALRVLLVIINKDHLTFLWPYFLNDLPICCVRVLDIKSQIIRVTG